MATAEAPAASAAAAAAGAQLQSSTTQQQQSQQAGAGSANRILFLVVVSGADLDCLEDPKPSGPRYTRDSLRNLLQLLGCKPRLAVKVMVAVFQAVDSAVTTARQQRISRKTFQVHPHRNGKVYVSLTRADFMSLVSSCAAQYSYKISPSSEELKVACSLRERRRCVVVLLCGTSGSGKSTLASILASRLGITTVVSTDSIRHMMRSFISQQQSPLLWASTYQAGEHLGDSDKAQKASSESELAVYGYKAQCALLSEHLELLIAGCEARTQSLICEGVHLNISSVAKLMARHPSVLPFLVYIPSESRHVERMAVRAKYMTLDPNKNRYVRYMGNIRLIQEYLVRKADKYAVPRVDNSNVDRSVGIIHLTVMSCLRRMARGEPVLDPATGRTAMLAAECAAVLDHLQGEKERLTAATAAAHASSSSSATTQQHLQQQLLQQHVQHPPDAGVGLQQHEAGVGSSSGSRGASLAAQDRQQQAGISGTCGQQPPPPTAVLMGSAPDETAGSDRAGAITQGGARAVADRQQGPAAAAAAAAAAGDGPGLTASGPVGQQQQQPLHQLHGGTSVDPTPCGEHHQTPAASSSGSLAGAGLGSCSAAAPGSTVSSAVQAGGMEQGMWPQDQQQQQGQEQQLMAAPSPGAGKPAPGGVIGGVLDASTQAHAAKQQAGGTACQHAQQQQPHPTGTLEGLAGAQQQPAPASSGNGCSGSRGSGESAGSITAEPATASSSDRGMQLPGRPSCGDAAGAGSSGDTFDQHGQQQQQQQQQQQHLQARVQQQQPGQQQQQIGGQQQQQQAAECEGESDAELVSSGEELDGLGELGSSDNEGERFLQEYGSVYESTTCDEHDDYDEAGGLRAWHTGMATALWPSYSHVYAPGAAAANGPGGLVLPAGAGTAGVLLPAAARAGAGSRVLRASQSEFGGAASGTATAVSNSSSNAGARGVQQGPASSSAGPGVLVPGVAPPSAASRPYALPTVYEGQQPQQQRRGQEGLGRPPLPAAAGGVSSLDAASSSARAAAAAAARGGMGRHVPRSSSLQHSGRHRPRSAGSNSGGSSSAAAPGAAPVMMRQWSADVQGRVSSPDPQPPSPPALVVAGQQPLATAEADAAANPTP